MDLRWSRQAFEDLASMRSYIAKDSPAYADLTVQRIVAVVERLGQFPDSGRVVPERQSSDLREVIVGKYRVVYRRSTDAVEIVTVFRGSRQFPDVVR